MSEGAAQWPRVEQANGSLEIELGASVGTLCLMDVWSILDIGAGGDIIGIEILNLRDQVGSHCRVSPTNAGIRGDAPSVAYDDDVDALYINLRREYSPEQRPAEVRIGIDSRGELISVEVDWQSGI